MKNKRGSIILAALLILAIIIGGIYLITKFFDVDTQVNINLNPKNETKENITQINQKENQTQIANPASLLCTERNHKLEMRISQSKGEYGVCIDDEGNECEEWAYFRGECELTEKNKK